MCAPLLALWLANFVGRRRALYAAGKVISASPNNFASISTRHQVSSSMTDHELQILTWQFAALIGIVQPSSAYATAEQVAKDRAQWPDLIVIKNGQLMFDFDRCAEWMAEVSGEPLRLCREVLFAEWGDVDDQKHAWPPYGGSA
jgi:hypothetical protein